MKSLNSFILSLSVLFPYFLLPSFFVIFCLLRLSGIVFSDSFRRVTWRCGRLESNHWPFQPATMPCWAIHRRLQWSSWLPFDCCYASCALRHRDLWCVYPAHMRHFCCTWIKQGWHWGRCCAKDSFCHNWDTDSPLIRCFKEVGNEPCIGDIQRHRRATPFSRVVSCLSWVARDSPSLRLHLPGCELAMLGLRCRLRRANSK